MAAKVAQSDSTTPGRTTARAIRDLMDVSPFDLNVWLLHKLTHFNVKIIGSNFPRESMEIVFSALDTILELTISIPQDDSLSFEAYSAFVLFPRLILRLPPLGCKGKHGALAFVRRSKMMLNGQVSDFLREEHDSHVTRVASRVHALTHMFEIFPRIARVVALVGCGAVGKACKLAISYGTESDPVIVASFLAKVTKMIPYTHAPLPPSSYKIVLVPIPIKVVKDAFTGMP